MIKPLTPTVLTFDLLKEIDKYYRDNYYTNARTPLLGYTPDSVIDFAKVIYDYIIVPTRFYPEMTKADYIKYFANIYLEAVNIITPALEGFIGHLEGITADPHYTLGESRPYIEEYITFYRTGEDTEDGYNKEHFPALHDFFYSLNTPLNTYPYVNDGRINNIKKETDSLQASHNERLNRFVWVELNKLMVNIQNQKEMPTSENPMDNTKEEQLLNLFPEVEEIVNQFLMPADPKLQKQTQEQDQNKPQKRAKIWIPAKPKTETKSSTPEEYLESFIRDLEPHYNNLSTKYVGLHTPDPANPLVSRPDETFAYIHAVKYANAHNLDLSTVLAQQSEAQLEVVNFDNIKPVLLACMQVYLYKLSKEDAIPSSDLNHGAVNGILEAINPYISRIISRQAIDYRRFAEELYGKILEHTYGFATALPLPDVTLLTAETIATTAKVEKISTGEILPFDLTPRLARVIHDMQADIVTASTEVLSETPDPTTLDKVDIKTLKNVAYLLIGRACTLYLLEGNLIIHDETDGKYYKITPTIGKDNYASYSFRVYNHQNLSSRIYQQQNLLKTSAKYTDDYTKDYNNDNVEEDPFTDTSNLKRTVTDEDLGHIKYKPLPQGDPQSRREVIERLSEWDKELTERINDVFNDTDYYKEHAKAQETYRKISSIQYFHPFVIFISAHKLAAYVYYPQEYSDLIIRKPLDPVTGEPVVYHIHHVGGKGSEHDNRRENLRIITKQLNDELRHTSRPVVYKGTRYNTIKSYCNRTNAGHYSALNQAINTLTSGDQVTFKDRIYSIDPDTEDIVVTDDEQVTRYTYNGIVYMGLPQLTEALNLKYPTIQKGIWRAKNAGKTEYKHKRYKFYLEDNNDITVTLI